MPLLGRTELAPWMNCGFVLKAKRMATDLCLVFSSVSNAKERYEYKKEHVLPPSLLHPLSTSSHPSISTPSRSTSSPQEPTYPLKHIICKPHHHHTNPLPHQPCLPTPIALPPTQTSLCTPSKNLAHVHPARPNPWVRTARSAGDSRTRTAVAHSEFIRASTSTSAK